MYLFIYSSSLKSSFSGASDDDYDDVCVCCVCVYLRRALLRFFASSLSLSSVSKVDKKRYHQQIFPTLIFRSKRKKKHVILTPHRVDVVVVLQVLDFVVVSLVFVDDAMQIRRIGDR